MLKTLQIVVIGAEHLGPALLNPLCRFLNYGSAMYRLDRATVLIVDPTHADSITTSLRRDFENIDIAAQQSAVEQGNVADLIPENAVVFCCVPNLPTAKIVSDHCETLKNVTAIRGGCDCLQGVAQVFVRRKGKNITLPFTNRYHPEVASPREDDDPRPQSFFTNFALASVMLNAFHAFLIDRPGEYDEVYVDVVEQQVRPYNRRSRSLPAGK